MKELNSVQNLIFRIGAVAFVVGLGLHLFMPFVGMVIYVVGLAAFVSMQFLTRYEGNDLVIARLRRQQLISDVFFVLSGVVMMMQEFKYGPMELRRNQWTIFLVAGCVLQLYTAFRIPSELEKQQRNQQQSPSSGKGLLKIFILLLSVSLFPSCVTQYNIEGTTNISELEGRVLHLKTFRGDELFDVDSCKIQHGRIRFNGVLDSTQMVFLFQNEQSLIPLVLEDGVIELTLDENHQNVTGTPLNDTLYNFIHQKLRIDMEMENLPRLETQLIMDGVEEFDRNQRLFHEEKRLMLENDRLMTSFIIRNSDNVLGPGVFMILTTSYPYPQITPQINEIMFRSKPFLKNTPCVRSYMKAAQMNMEKIHLGESE